MTTENPELPDGRHDFDFLHGLRRSVQRRLRERLADCDEWDEFPARPAPPADITATSARWAQALSADDGRTWETNWTAEFARAASRIAMKGTLAPARAVM